METQCTLQQHSIAIILYTNTPPYSFVSRSEGISDSLAYVDTTTNRAIMKVDNTTTVAYNDKRNTVRIATQDRFSVGSIWTADIYHVPYGVSTSSTFTQERPLLTNVVVLSMARMVVPGS